MTLGRKLVLVVFLLNLNANAQAALRQNTDLTLGKAKVSVIGLEVHQPLAKHEEEFKVTDRSGVVVHLLIHVKDRMIIDLDDNSSCLTHFSDDKGTNLLKDEKNKQLSSSQWLCRGKDFLKFNKNGYCAVRVETPMMPTTGSGKIRIKGQFGCELGKESLTKECNTTLMKKDEAYKLGPLSFWYDEKHLSLNAEKPNRIKSILFFDIQGKRIKPSQSYNTWGESSISFGNNTTSKTFTFGNGHHFDVECAKIEVDYFATHETVTIPFDVEISLGLK